MYTAMYLRKSRAEEGAGSWEETLSKHREALSALARRMKLTIGGCYEEVLSGESLLGRPEMLRLLQDVEAGKYDAVLCMDIDRLGRGGMKDQGIILETFKIPAPRSSRRIKSTIFPRRRTRSSPK